MHHNTDLLTLAEKYFIQNVELFGSELYVESDLLSKNKRMVHSSIQSYFREIKDCQKCQLSKSRTKFVFGTGNSNAELMCIGEAPGHDEDQAGEPFVGAAGQLLNRILAAIGFQREEVYIANIIKCRPPDNRDPLPAEISECFPYLKRQIELINPKLILVLGRVAAQNLLGTQDSLSALRNRVHKMDDIQVIVTYHPAALLRNPQWKRSTWEDVQKLRKLYDEVVGDKPRKEIRN